MMQPLWKATWQFLKTIRIQPLHSQVFNQIKESTCPETDVHTKVIEALTWKPLDVPHRGKRGSSHEGTRNAWALTQGGHIRESRQSAGGQNSTQSPHHMTPFTQRPRLTGTDWCLEKGCPEILWRRVSICTVVTKLCARQH